MGMKKYPGILWLVVEVIGGFPEKVTVCADKKRAVQLEKSIRERQRPDYDEVAVFRLDLGWSDMALSADKFITRV